jgi:hypothetical protein
LHQLQIQRTGPSPTYPQARSECARANIWVDLNPTHPLNPIHTRFQLLKNSCPQRGLRHSIAASQARTIAILHANPTPFPLKTWAHSPVILSRKEEQEHRPSLIFVPPRPNTQAERSSRIKTENPRISPVFCVHRMWGLVA